MTDTLINWFSKTERRYRVGLMLIGIGFSAFLMAFIYGFALMLLPQSWLP